LGEHNCFTGTERAAGKELECPALFRPEMTLSRGLPIRGPSYTALTPRWSQRLYRWSPVSC
jgi:hypothetical protein